jgi:hypothetical protein
VRHPAARDSGLVVPLDQQEPQAIGERLLDYGNLLRAQRRQQRPVEGQSQGQQFLPMSYVRHNPQSRFNVSCFRETTLSQAL